MKAEKDKRANKKNKALRMKLESEKVDQKICIRTKKAEYDE